MRRTYRARDASRKTRPAAMRRPYPRWWSERGRRRAGLIHAFEAVNAEIAEVLAKFAGPRSAAG